MEHLETVGRVLFKIKPESNWGAAQSKIKIRKNVWKTILRAHLKCSVQKAASKDTKYWQNDNFLKIGKIGQNAWAIAFAKCSLWVKN